MSSQRVAFVQARESLLAEITESLRNGERFVAAWLAGSFGRGQQSWQSDLDLHVVVAEAYSEVLCAMPWRAGGRTTPERLALFQHFGTPAIIYDSHGNNQLGGTFTHIVYQESAQNVDWMLTPQQQAHVLPETLLLFDKVGLPAAPAEELETREEQCERASMHVSFFWMIASANIMNLLAGDVGEFHMLLLWMEDNLHELRAALRGEQARWISNTHSRVYATREEQIAALRHLCDEMEALMPAVVELGGYLPPNPRAMVEMRLALFTEE
ncbi:MAG: hypothetical protein ABI413_00775 [Ktedonobacteraceae bacterium]